MDELILGIDDAGRGPVIGPMVLAGCLLTQEQMEKLKKLGVKDSKELTQKRREFLFEKIKEIAETFEVSIKHSNEIDKNLLSGKNLNEVEAIQTAEIINKINKGFKKIKVIVDCPSISIEKWKNLLRTKIHNLLNLEIICEHKADKNYVAVSAASIIAKIFREKEMLILKEKYGKDIGSGYASDSITQRFLKEHAHKHKDEGLFRQTWEPWKKASNNLKQMKLF